uniref:BHLH domain-containing protein n=1 Tax=Opuntia streptacantha TaxID=393608 RepID=A0A7C9EK48_OPUST
MVETSGSRHCQQHSPWELSAFGSRMIAPFELRQYESLPASTNPCVGSSTLGVNGLEFPGFPERRLTRETNGLLGKSWPHPRTPFLAPEHTPLFSTGADVQPSAYELPSCPQEKQFLIFDQSGDETRLIFSSLCPGVQNLTTAEPKCSAWSPQDAPTMLFGGNHFPTGKQADKAQQVWVKVPTLHEESGENEIVEEGSGFREDTDDINALLYSSDDDGSDSNRDEDNDELSTGRSPSTFGGEREELKECDEKDFDEVDSFDISSKRQKTADGAHNELSLLHATAMSRENLSYDNIHSGDMRCALGHEETGPTIGKKRLRKEKIRDTLRALESIIPGVKSNNPLIILDEAISYLKCLKHNAQVMCMEDPDISSCRGPLH